MEARADRIERALLTAFAPTVLILEDESHNHGAHREVRTAKGEVLHDHAHHPSTSQVVSHEVVGGREGLRAGKKSPETHFKVLVVSTVFQGLPRVNRQRQVYELLADELKSGLHALTIRALTPDEYATGAAEGFVSPACANRAKRNL